MSKTVRNKHIVENIGKGIIGIFSEGLILVDIISAVLN